MVNLISLNIQRRNTSPLWGEQPDLVEKNIEIAFYEGHFIYFFALYLLLICILNYYLDKQPIIKKYRLLLYGLQCICLLLVAFLYKSIEIARYEQVAVSLNSFGGYLLRGVEVLGPVILFQIIFVFISVKYFKKVKN